MESGETAPARARAAIAGELAALEARRRAALASGWQGALALVLGPALGIAPLLLVAWTAVELAPGVTEPALRRIARAAFQASPPALIGAALVLWPALGMAGGVIAFRRLWISPRAAYLHEYKRRVYSAVCAAHFPGIVYEPAGGIPWRAFDESRLFPFASNSYASEDRFRGRYGATEVCFAEAVAQRSERRGFGENRETVWITYFRGLVFIADFNKHFHSTTRLLPRDSGAAPVSGEKRIALEDPRFEAVFQTWSSDAIDARYVLSFSLMERLMTLNERHPGLRARFEGGRLLLLLPLTVDRFEPSIERSAHDVGQVERFVAELRECLGVVDALNLDTRIWSKR